MPEQTKTFRVFLSSTFTDWELERNALQQQVWPELEKVCAGRGYRFQAVDLRWGISEVATQSAQIMRICLNEIERCQRLSPRPNFIALVGDRYGYRPVPEA